MAVACNRDQGGPSGRHGFLTFAVFVTNFADQAVLVPSAIAVAAGFGLAGWHRGALAWSGVLACTWISILVLKLTFLIGGSLWLEGLHSPSGHTAGAAAAAGGFFGLIVRRWGGGWLWTLPISAGLAITIGMSRLALHVHTGVDVLVAGVVGVLGAVTMVALAGPPPSKVRLSPIITALTVMILLLHGFQAPAEVAIRRIAMSEFWDELHLGGFARQNCRVPGASLATAGAKGQGTVSDRCGV